VFSIIIVGAKSNLEVVDDEQQGCWPSVVATSQHTSISVQLMNHVELSGIRSSKELGVDLCVSVETYRTVCSV
jgi:hypothetical protein